MTPKKKLLLFPGFFDPHICLGPLSEESWEIALHSGIRGGVTTLIDLPCQEFPCRTKEEIEEKKEAVQKRLFDLNLPLEPYFYATIDMENVEGMGQIKKLIKGALFLDFQKRWDDHQFEHLFNMAALKDVPLVIDAKKSHLEKAIHYAEKESARLLALNVHTKEHIELIEKAKKHSVLILGETTPAHLFSDDESEREMLFDAIKRDIIESIGSGFYAEHRGEVRALIRGSDFSFQDPILVLPLLFNAYHQGEISLEKIAQITHFNISEFLELKRSSDMILVDLEEEELMRKIIGEEIQDFKLKGWPLYTIIKGHIFISPQWGYQAKTVL